MDKVLEVKALKKEYKGFVLDEVSFCVEPKSVVGFIGTNGSGKSTTIKSILGLINSKSELINYFGLPLKSNEKIIKKRLGIVLDDGYFYETLTINQMKNVIAPAYDNWEENVFNELLFRFGLNSKQKLSTLSKGMKMKFSIALALAHHAELIIMDEPTSGLDPLTRNEFVLLLQEIVKKENCSIFFSTHIISDLEKVADKIIFIDKGKIVFDKNKNDLLSEYRAVLDKEDISIEDIMLYHIKGESWNDF